MVCRLVVYRSSETSTNQSDVIIRSDDRFLNLVVDSDSIVSKICMLNFVLWLVFFFCLHTDKNIAVLSQLVFFALNTDKHLAILSKRTFDTQSIHIFGLVYYLSTSRNSPFYIGCYTYGKRSLFSNTYTKLFQILLSSFCSKLMFTNGNIVVCKYIIWFYSNLYFCQTHIWTSLLFIYLYQVLHIWKTIFCFVLF